MMSRSSSAYQPLDSTTTSGQSNYLQHQSQVEEEEEEEGDFFEDLQHPPPSAMKDSGGDRQGGPQRQHSSCRRKTKKLSRENAVSSNGPLLGTGGGGGSTSHDSSIYGGAPVSRGDSEHALPPNTSGAPTRSSDVHEMTSIAVISSVAGAGGGGSSGGGPFRNNGGAGGVVSSAMPTSSGAAGAEIDLDYEAMCSKNNEKITWTNFHFVMCIGIVGFFVFWIVLLCRMYLPPELNLWTIMQLQNENSDQMAANARANATSDILDQDYSPVPSATSKL